MEPIPFLSEFCVFLNAENAEEDAEFAEKKPVIYSLIFKETHYLFAR